MITTLGTANVQHNTTIGKRSVEQSLLIFEVEGSFYALPSISVKKIFLYKEVDRFRNKFTNPAEPRGMVFRDKKVIITVDMKKLLSPCDTGEIENCAVLVVEYGNHEVGFVVDECLGIEHFSAFETDTSIQDRLFHNECSPFSGANLWNDEIVLVLDAKRFISAQHVLQIDEAISVQDDLQHKWEELHHKEEQVSAEPSVQGYLQLADLYEELGLGKEAARMLEQAENLESRTAKVESTSDENYLLRGKSNLHMFVEVLQVLNRTERTGKLLLESNDVTSTLYFSKGEIIQAKNSHQPDGLDSFYECFKCCYGTYSFTEQRVDDVETTITKPCGPLIVDAVRQLDELAG